MCCTKTPVEHGHTALDPKGLDGVTAPVNEYIYDFFPFIHTFFAHF